MMGLVRRSWGFLFLIVEPMVSATVTCMTPDLPRSPFSCDAQPATCTSILHDIKDLPNVTPCFIKQHGHISPSKRRRDIARSAARRRYLLSSHGEKSDSCEACIGHEFSRSLEEVVTYCMQDSSHGFGKYFCKLGDSSGLGKTSGRQRDIFPLPHLATCPKMLNEGLPIAHDCALLVF